MRKLELIMFVMAVGVPWSAVAQPRTHMDFDHDGRAELCTARIVALDRPARWTCDVKVFDTVAEYWDDGIGLYTDKWVPGDYDGDFFADPAVYRPSTGQWFIRQFGPSFRIVQWGIPGDIPVPADYDGDGRTDTAVYRPSNRTWYIPGMAPIVFGDSRAILPLPADYDGDFRADPAFFAQDGTSGIWLIRSTRFCDGLIQCETRWGQAGDIPVPADYGGGPRTEIAVFRPATGEWFIKDMMTVRWGQRGDIPIPLDYEGAGRASLIVLRQTGEDDSRGEFLVRGFDGSLRKRVPGTFRPGLARTPVSTSAGEFGSANRDRRAELTVFRPSTGEWHAKYSALAHQSTITYTLGDASDTPVGADFGPLGTYFPATFRDGVWKHLFGSDVQWGLPGDIPVPGDYVGALGAQHAVFRPSNGTWYVQRMNPVQWGQATDVPVPADYDGDGRLDIAVWRPSNGTWYILPSSGKAVLRRTFGGAGDIPLPADYDGDGLADFVVYRPSTATWYAFPQVSYFAGNGVITSSSAVFGTPGDVPVPADYDGDGVTDLATWTPSTGMWNVRNQFSVQWGQPGDVPVVTVNR
jgi:hypothetical protein